MVDFSNVTSKKSGRVEIVFENDNIAEKISKDYDQREFQNEVREGVKKLGWNLKKGEITYLIINSQGFGRHLRQSDYDKWAKTEKKDWFHQEKPPLPPFVRDIVKSIIIEDMLSDLGLSGILGGIMLPQGLMLPGIMEISIHRRDTGTQKNGEFSGPSREQSEEIDRFILDQDCPDKIVKIATEKNCEACPMTDCEGRKSSFSMDTFKEIFEPATKS